MTTVYIEQKDAPVHLPYSLVFWPNFRFPLPSKRLFLKEVMEQYQMPFFALSSRPEEADFFAVPFEYFFVQKEHPAYLARVFAAAAAAGKKVLLFDYTDYVDWIPKVPSHAILFRVSAYRHHRRHTDIVMPYFVEDMGIRYGMAPKAKSREPVIGYCGQSLFGSPAKAFRARLKQLVYAFRLLLSGDTDSASHQRGIFWRKAALRVLRTGGFPSRIIERPFYALHSFSNAFDPTAVRNEYVQNLRECELALCVRGDANASQRLYEALSARRVPLLVDTDCVLPLEEVVDYDAALLRTPARELATLPTRVRSWWERETSESFLARGAHARDIYERYLRLDRFFARVFDRAQSPYRQLLFGRESV